MKRLAFTIVLLLAVASGRADDAAPLFRDFVGLCGHTVSFKPESYTSVCRIVRDYHPATWDLGRDTGLLPEWPFARNRVSWERVYGSWHKAGLGIDVCLQIDEMPTNWTNLARDARAYARSFAGNFGPGGRWPYVDAIEIGNEPGRYDDATYRVLFEAMAQGIREGNPRVRIVTCNTEAGPSDRYCKGADLFADRTNLFDVLQTHQYAIEKQWPVWSRTYPENPDVPYLSKVRKLLAWRDAHAPGKPVWVTEFGWDSSTRKPDPKGEWAKWQGSTDEQQAMWLVRSFLLFSEMGVEKAFVYFFDDKDEPKLHASSGLTRNGGPKPAFHAVSWMLQTLANHRFSRAIRKDLKDGFVFEFSPERPGAPVVLAAWHATAHEQPITIPLGELQVLRAERMPLTAGGASSVAVDTGRTGEVVIAAGERPVFIWATRQP